MDSVLAVLFHTFVMRNLIRSGLSTESFLAFCDLEWSKLLNSLLEFFLK